MRLTTQLVCNMIGQPIFSSFLMITLNFKGTSFYYTTLPFDVTLDGTTYSADNNFLTIEPPKTGNSLAKDTYTVKLADPQFLFKGYCENAAASILKVRIGFINNGAAPVTSTGGTLFYLGQPILDKLDTILVYEGKIDNLQYVMGDDNGIVLEIKATSPMGALDASNVFYTTSHALLQRSPLIYDTAFDNVTIDSKAQLLLWGKVA